MELARDSASREIHTPRCANVRAQNMSEKKDGRQQCNKEVENQFKKDRSHLPKKKKEFGKNAKVKKQEGQKEKKTEEKTAHIKEEKKEDKGKKNNSTNSTSQGIVQAIPGTTQRSYHEVTRSTMGG